MTAGCRVEVLYMLIAGSINSGYLFWMLILRRQPSETISLQAVFYYSGTRQIPSHTSVIRKVFLLPATTNLRFYDRCFPDCSYQGGKSYKESSERFVKRFGSNFYVEFEKKK